MSERAHILIVEDELTSRTMLSGYFESEGYLISEADSGAEMRRAFAAGKIDLIMLDIHLPDEDGLTLLKECAALFRCGYHHGDGEIGRH